MKGEKQRREPRSRLGGGTVPSCTLTHKQCEAVMFECGMLGKIHGMISIQANNTVVGLLNDVKGRVGCFLQKHFCYITMNT